MKRNYIRQKKRGEKGLDTYYGDKPEDIGNLNDYKEFIREQRKIFNGVYEILKDFGYLVIITNNVFFNGRLYPLAFDTLISISEKWVPKDEKSGYKMISLFYRWAFTMHGLEIDHTNIA